MMTVTEIEPVSKTRFKVYIEGQFAFVLYKGELSRYHIRSGEKIEQEVYEKIRKEIVLKRAKLRAMHLLNDMERSEQQLYQKLKQGGYPEDIVEQAVEYVKSFGYINDSAYALRFVNSRKEKKSRKEIYAALVQRGIAKEWIDIAMEEAYGENEEKQAIKALLRKKNFNPESATDEQKRKIYGYLARKGFGYEDIRQVIQVSE